MYRILRRDYRRQVRRRIQFMHWLRVLCLCLCLPAGAALGIYIFIGGAGLIPGVEAAPEVFTERGMMTPEEDFDCLTLVNSRHPLPPDYRLELTRLPEGVYVDGRICPALEEMFREARGSGIYPAVRSGYRTGQQQRQSLDSSIDFFRSQGMTAEKAMAAAARREESPGHSEHQLGLAVDIGGDGTNSSDEHVYRWLAENSYRFGFVLRYSGEKSELTGMDYAPEHYRYVGREAAGIMYTENLCLEEYLARSGEVQPG